MCAGPAWTRFVNMLVGRSTKSESKGGLAVAKEVHEAESGRSATSERLVDAAMELFLEYGYGATGVAQILRKAKVNSGSLYYFFRTKEDLLLAVLERYRSWLRPVVLEPAFAITDDPIDRVLAVLSGYRQMLTVGDCRTGCPIAAIALEMSEKSEAVRKLVAENFEGWRLGIRECLNAAADRLPADVDCDKLAAFVLTVMEGAVIQSRTYHSVEPLDASVELLRDYFDRLLAKSA